MYKSKELKLNRRAAHAKILDLDDDFYEYSTAESTYLSSQLYKDLPSSVVDRINEVQYSSGSFNDDH